MIKGLRIKFIVLSMVAVIILLGIIVAGMNLFNYRAVLTEAEETLQILAQNKGTFSGFRPDEAQGEFNGEGSFRIFPEETENGVITPEEWNSENADGREFRPPKLPKGMSPETPYESRFFSVLLNEDGEVMMTDVREIASVTEDQAAEYAKQILQDNREKGFLGDYLFIRIQEENGTRIIFLDCGRRLESFRTFLLISVIASAAGCILFFFVIFFYSKRITKPVAESYEKQKRFITDAGHEIKTPLAIIKADADVLEMDYEDNEWVQDIRKQTERLTTLTNDLVSLARMEEGSQAFVMSEFCLSDAVEEEASAYQMMAQAEEKELELEIQPAVFLNGDEKTIRRLVNIFMDNAMKYSPEKTAIRLQLAKSGKQIRLSVFNQTKEPVKKENLALLFDRFYRMDSSRNSETGGHGIGLSMAKAIVEAHGGKLSANTEDGMSLQMNAVFPG